MFKGCHFPDAIILTCIRWYARFKLSYRDIEELMAERGIVVDHATINRWVVKFSPRLLERGRQHKTPVGSCWRMHETYMKVHGRWKYLYRAVGKAGDTVDLLLTPKRDRSAALRFLRRAIDRSGAPLKVTIDCSGANTAALETYNAGAESQIEIRQCWYLNSMVEQDHRFVKQKARAALGFKRSVPRAPRSWASSSPT